MLSCCTYIKTTKLKKQIWICICTIWQVQFIDHTLLERFS